VISTKAPCLLLLIAYLDTHHSLLTTAYFPISLSPPCASILDAIRTLILGGGMMVWQRFTAAVVSGMAIALSGSTDAIAQRITSPAPELSPVELTQSQGQCRLVNRQIGIYVEPNVFSESLGVLPEEEIVVLGNGSGRGWARIIHPTIGWIDARNLGPVRCPADLANLEPPRAPAPFPSPMPQPAPQPMPQPGVPDPGSPDSFPQPDSVSVGGMCAVVTYRGEEGLAIRTRPDASARSTGSLSFSQPAVQLTGSEFREPGGRLWVELATGGWIAATGPTGASSGTNIGVVPCREIAG
jgi:hypothetical protein